MRAHQLNKFVVDDLDHGFARVEAVQHFGTDGTLAHLVDEGLDHAERDIRFQQRDTHFTQRFLDIALAQPATTTQGFEGPFKSIA